jgi:hypothetical protein
MGGECGTNGSMRSAYKLPDGRSEGKRQPGRPTPRFKDNIKMGLKEMVSENID